MKQVDLFVDTVYQNTKGNKKEILEMKAEMRTHLIEAVYDLKQEGIIEEEAVKIAISRFGEEKEIRTILGEMFKAQQVFAKWILYLSLVFLVLFLSVFGWLWHNAEEQSSQISNVATEIATVLENKTTITPEMIMAIENSIKNTDFITTVKIFDVRGVKEGEKPGDYSNVFEYVEKATPDYKFNQAVWSPEWLKPAFYSYGNGDNQWYVSMEQRVFSKVMTIILFVGVTIYWTLFTIWATINAYHQKRLNIAWIIIFALSNIFGFLVYYLVGKRKVMA